jgi:YidC/Oxa1 family membrane protein insertase
MFDAVASALAFFYDLWPSYAGAIILLTLALMLLLTPLSIKGTRSMIAMARLQPELKKLQQKHKNDREKLNQEMLAFYQEHKINPLAGCLPLILQMPIFIVLYRVIDGLGRAQEKLASADTPEALRQACDAADRAGEMCIVGPKYLSPDTSLYQDLARTIKNGSIHMVSFGVDLTQSMTKALDESIVEAIPFVLLVALVAITGYVQQRQVSARQKGVPVNPQQQMLTRLMPGFFALISIGIPAGVVLYFVVSNGVRIGQQYLVTRMDTPSTTASSARERRSEPRDTPADEPPIDTPSQERPRPGTAPRGGAGAAPANRARKKKKKRKR